MRAEAQRTEVVARAAIGAAISDLEQQLEQMERTARAAEAQAESAEAHRQVAEDQAVATVAELAAAREERPTAAKWQVSY